MDPKTIFISGGSGFVGSAVIDELVSRGYSVHALTNRAPLPDDRPQVTSIPGGLFDPAAIDVAMQGCAAAIHLVGIIMEKPAKGITFRRIHVDGTQAVLDGIARAGVKRLVHMSAVGSRDGAPAEYHRTKFEAEERIRKSSLDWTIVRPSMVHGPRGEFMQMEVKWAKRKAPPFLFMPYFGRGFLGLGGAGRIQPVHVKDVARAFVDALEKPQTIGQTYEIGGADVLTWPQMHHLASRAIVGKERAAVALPAWYAKLLASVVPGSLLPFNRDQVLMSQEESTADLTAFRRDFGWEPAGFAAALSEYASGL